MTTCSLSLLVIIDFENLSDKSLFEHYWRKFIQPACDRNGVKLVVVTHSPARLWSQLNGCVNVLMSESRSSYWSLVFGLDSITETHDSDFYCILEVNTFVNVESLIGLVRGFGDNNVVAGVMGETDMRVNYAIGGAIILSRECAQSVLSNKHNVPTMSHAAYDILISQSAFVVVPRYVELMIPTWSGATDSPSDFIFEDLAFARIESDGLVTSSDVELLTNAGVVLYGEYTDITDEQKRSPRDDK